MNILLLKGFNNYFNRIVKVKATLQEYILASQANKTLTSVNFNPNDGVNTEMILGTDDLADWDSIGSADYLVCYETSGTGESGDPIIDTINSRWFITDVDRTRLGQYHVSLKRDVIADNYDAVMEAPCFVEKGMVPNTSDPLLFNKENMTYNQIKQSERILKDKTGCAWVVGYIPQDYNSQKQISKNVALEITPNITVASLSSWSYYDAVSINNSGHIWSRTAGNFLAKVKIRYNQQPFYQSQNPNWKYGYADDLYLDIAGSSTASLSAEMVTQRSYPPVNPPVSVTPPTEWSGMVVTRSMENVDSDQYATAIPACFSSLSGTTNIITAMQNAANAQSITPSRPVATKTTTEINNLLALDGQILKDSSTGNIYKIKVKNMSASSSDNQLADTPEASTMLTQLNAGAATSGKVSPAGTINRADVYLGYSNTGYIIELAQQFQEAAVILSTNRSHVIDAPYDMFCIPFSSTKKIKYGSGSGDVVNCDKNLAIAIAEEIAKDAGAQAVYDVQLLPFCPCNELVVNNPSASGDYSTLNLNGLSIDLIKDITDSFVSISIANQTALDAAIGTYGTIYDSNYNPIYFYSSGTTYYYKSVPASSKVLGAIIWCSSATRTFEISSPFKGSFAPFDETDPISLKISNEVDVFRLVSGNYASMFEFSLAKSKGFMELKVDCNFKPFTPYFHIAPKLSNLYGDFTSFDDPRGLICSGDYSLAQLSNAWANYELQNKNYQNMFDRQIQNMDINNAIQNQEATWQAVAGTVSGGVSGAVAGGMVGGVYGAVAGGIAGTAASALGGVMDVQNLKKRQQEAKSYATDMYGYQLGNIKALPTSLTKVSAYNLNNKIFPIIEWYSCTEEEKSALRNKIEYDGMTIMKIDRLSTYATTSTFDYAFVRGDLIRLEIVDDAHVINEIYNEVKKGLYIPRVSN